MHITLNDPRSLAVAIVRPADDKFFNWGTGAWEQPFAAAAHLRPLVPMEAAPSAFATVQTADIGAELLTRPDVAALLVSVDAGGGSPTYTVADVWTLPSRTDPCFGGLTRL
jgi:hypothetical protein